LLYASIRIVDLKKNREKHRDVHGGAAATVVAGTALYFSLPSQRGAAAAASKKRKFKKLVNLHKIFILKNATL
jgi:hypothetical protein